MVPQNFLSSIFLNNLPCVIEVDHMLNTGFPNHFKAVSAGSGHSKIRTNDVNRGIRKVHIAPQTSPFGTTMASMQVRSKGQHPAPTADDGTQLEFRVSTLQSDLMGKAKPALHSNTIAD